MRPYAKMNGWFKSRNRSIWRGLTHDGRLRTAETTTLVGDPLLSPLLLVPQWPKKV
jgi:hypothetical protein